MDRVLPGDQDRLAPDRDLRLSATSERSLALVAVACLLIFAILAVWASVSPAADWEVYLSTLAALPPGLAQDLVNAINTLGNLPVWAIVVALIALAVGRLRGAIIAIAVALTFAADLAAFGVKLVVERARPATAATEHFFGPDAFAFPSGHVVRAVALAAVLAWVFAPPGSRLRLALLSGLVAGVVMGFARVSLGVHWPTDALGGMMLGLLWFALTALLLGRVAGARSRNENARPGRSPDEREQPPPT